MTTAKRSQYQVTASSAPDRRDTGPRRTAWFVAGALGLALVAAASAMTGPGDRLDRGIFHFLEFYCGVFCLVSLSIAIMVGLAATDRVVLGVRHRILMQGAHRALATAAMVFLGIHIATKIVEGHASVFDVVVPFLNGHRPVFVGLGTLASYLMIGITITGVVRGRFAGTSRVWLWRVLHVTAYACWPVALVHGLGAGRPAKTWVTVSYLLCVIAVGLALVVRACVAYGHRLRGPRTITTATLRPVGSVPFPPVPPAPAAPRREPVAADLLPPPPRPAPAPSAPSRPPAPARDPALARDSTPARDSKPARDSAPARVPAVAREPAPAGRSGARQTPPPPQQRRPERPRPRPESISDDEFWAFMRGGTPR